MRWANRSRQGWSIEEGCRLAWLAAARRSVRPIGWSTPRSKRAPKSDEKAPPSQSARMLRPATGGKHSCFGVEWHRSKPRVDFTEWIGHESSSIKDLHEV